MYLTGVFCRGQYCHPYSNQSYALASTADTPDEHRAPPPARLEPSRDSPVRVHTSDTAAVRAARPLSVSPPTARTRAPRHAVTVLNRQTTRIDTWQPC